MESALKFLSLATGPLALLVTIFLAIRRNTRQEVQDVKADSSDKLETEMKLKELENKVDVQYGELKVQIEGLEVAIAESKKDSTVFEERMITSFDKMDMKIERIQDLILKTLLNK